MKVILFIFCWFFLLLTGTYLFSQPTGSGTNVSGKAVDNKSKQPLPYTTVSLYRVSDSLLVTGGMTDSTGIFRLKAPVGGSYYLKADFLGFEPAFISGISITGEDSKVNTGLIALSPKMKLLQDVEIVDERPGYQLTMEKKTYYVGKDIVAVGGTVSDLLRNVPSINMDMDNQITVRGSSDVKILIDGKPSALMGGDQSALNQIPIYSIEKIELITNPSAKYDAEGMGGILNIVTKQAGGEEMQGFVNITAGYYHDHSGSLQLRTNKKKVKAYIGYDAKYQENTRNMKSERQFFSDSSTYYLDYAGDVESVELPHNVSGGGDWSVTEKFSAGLSGSYRYKKETGNRLTQYSRWDSLKTDDHYTGFTERVSQDESVKQNVDASLTLRKKFSKPGQMLSMDIFYSMGSDSQLQEGEQASYTTSDKTVQSGITEKNISSTGTPRQQGTVQADYVHPLNKKGSPPSGGRGAGKLETGLKSYSRQLNSRYSVAEFDTSGNIFKPVAAFNSDLEYAEQVHAGYVSVSSSIKQVQLLAGLRSEATFISIRQALQDTVPYKNSYIDFFPNLQVSYPLTEKLPAQFSYSRRITRPSYGQLDPSINFSDPQNIHRGNPYLMPEMTHSLELNFMPVIKTMQLQSSVYYKYSENTITRFRKQVTGDISQITYENAGWKQSYGIEVSLSQKIKYVRYNASVNLYSVTLDATNLLSTALRQFYSWNTRLNVTVPVKKFFDLMLSGFWQGPMQSPQGDIKPMYHADAGLKRDIGKSGEIALRFSDVFNTKRFEINASDPTFIIHARVKRLSQRIYLSFSYRINNYASTEKKMQREAEEMMME